MIPLEEREAALNGLLGEREALIQQATQLTAQRMELPRSALKEAKVLQLQIMSLQNQAKKLKVAIAAARESVDRIERHGLWEAAVKTLWGIDGLAAARAQMRQLKISRADALQDREGV